jgi:hypothetical protein
MSASKHHPTDGTCGFPIPEFGVDLKLIKITPLGKLVDFLLGSFSLQREFHRYISPDRELTYSDYVSFRFCPFCGEKLEQETGDSKERK